MRQAEVRMPRARPRALVDVVLVAVLELREPPEDARGQPRAQVRRYTVSIVPSNSTPAGSARRFVAPSAFSSSARRLGKPRGVVA